MDSSETERPFRKETWRGLFPLVSSSLVLHVSTYKAIGTVLTHSAPYFMRWENHSTWERGIEVERHKGIAEGDRSG